MILTHAIVLAAGLGTRMRPLTNTLPKPLISVGGKPLIDWCLDWLHDGGIAHVVVNTSYRADQLEAYVAHRPHPHVVISREEPEPLETGGGIAKALSLLGDQPFLAMNSDAIIQILNEHPINMLINSWSDDLDFLMLVVVKDRAIGWSGQGDFVIGEGGKLRRPQAQEDAPYIFTGIEIIHPRVFKNAPKGKFSLSTLWDASKGADGWYQRIRAVTLEGSWLNVGDLQGLEAVEAYLR